MKRAEDQQARIKVAVLGGGMGAMAAAWQLVRLDPGGYDITVYQRGWRLGGKAASGRNRDPGKGLRIEEHGLHILMGFYEHVFHIVKTCYDELGPRPADSAHGGIGTWREALGGSDHLHVADRYRDGHHEIWELALPAHDRAAPGTNPPEEPDVAHWMGNGLAFIYESIRQIEGASAPARPWLDLLARTLVGRESSPARMRADLLGGLTQTSVRWALSHLFNHLGDPEARDAASILRRRQAMTAYFVGANLLGVMSNGLWCKQDFLRYAERVDHLDYREWLHRNTGVIGEGWPELAWASPLVDSVYDLIFSQHCGFGAGTALYDTLCMLLGYRNQLYYRMNGGMGDVVFAPLYLWLRRKGVKFRFFQRVRKLSLESPGLVGQITLEEQVDLGGAEYDPLFPARDRACWPSAPLLERLPERERRRLERSGCDLENGAESQGPLRHLRRGRDFDVAVLGLPVGVLQREGELVGELTAAHPPFAEMVRGLQTARTRAFQIWTDRDAPGLGWDGQPGMMGAYRRPFGSWADMSHVLAQEDWGAGGSDRPGQLPGGQDVGPRAVAVKGVHYFCGVDEGPPATAAAPPSGELPGERVRREAEKWLQGSFPALLPGWTWDRTWAAEGRGSERFAAQYWRANEAPSERYVLAAPGTLRFRLAAGASGFDNLFLAGDWVKTDLNAGCVEAAAMAGVEAARAIHQRARQLVVPARRAPLPAYVDRDSDWVLRAPVHAADVTTVAFVLRADPEALAALCAEQIAHPTEGQVTAEPWPPQAGLVLLICSQMPHIQSGDEEHGPVGHFREHDVGFFVPVTLGSADGSGVGMLAPYLFVDSAIGLSAGREIYGFSKLLARIEMPLARPGRGFELPPGVTVTSDVVAAGRTVEQATVLEVIPSKETPSAPTLATRPLWWRLLPLLGSALAGTRRPARRAEAGPGGRRGPSFAMPMVFLKQFRDAVEPAAACHQSLVQCGARAVLATVPRRLQGTFVVRMPWHAKPDLAGTLGLPSELETNLALQVEHDLYLPQGRQLWP